MSAYTEHVAKWKNCQRCELAKTRRRVALCRGTIPCDVLFVGEAPGLNEDSLGQPFIGPAGKLLDRIIARSVQSTVSYALTNLVGCLPTGDDGTKAAQPSRESIEACSPRLYELVRMAQPKLIVRVGGLAEREISGEAQFDPTWLEGEEHIELISIIHPAAILRMDQSQKGLAIQRCIVAIENAVEYAVIPF